MIEMKKKVRIIKILTYIRQTWKRSSKYQQRLTYNGLVDIRRCRFGPAWVEAGPVDRFDYPFPVLEHLGTLTVRIWFSPSRFPFVAILIRTNSTVGIEQSSSGFAVCDWAILFIRKPFNGFFWTIYHSSFDHLCQFIKPSNSRVVQEAQ